MALSGWAGYTITYHPTNTAANPTCGLLQAAHTRYMTQQLEITYCKSQEYLPALNS